MLLLSESPHEDEQPDSVLLASLLITLVRGDSWGLHCRLQTADWGDEASGSRTVGFGVRGWHSYLKCLGPQLLYSKILVVDCVHVCRYVCIHTIWLRLLSQAVWCATSVTMFCNARCAGISWLKTVLPRMNNSIGYLSDVCLPSSDKAF